MVRPQALTSYVDREFDLPGSYWGERARGPNEVMDDADVLYPAVVKEVDMTHKVKSISGTQPMVRVELKVSANIDDSEIWIDLKLFSGYIKDDAQGLSQHPGCGLVGCHRLCTSHSRARVSERSGGDPGGPCDVGAGCSMPRPAMADGPVVSGPKSGSSWHCHSEQHLARA